MPDLRSSYENVVGRVDIECLTLNHVLRSVHTVVVDVLRILCQQGTGNDHRLGRVIAQQDGRVVRTAEARTSLGHDLTLRVAKAADVVDTIAYGGSPAPVVVVIGGEDVLVAGLVDAVATLGDGVGDVVGDNADVGGVVVKPAWVGTLDGVVDVMVVALEGDDRTAFFENAVPLEWYDGKLADIGHGGRSGGADDSSAESKERGSEHFAIVFAMNVSG